MSIPEPPFDLVEQLEAYGIRCASASATGQVNGFPVVLSLNNGSRMVLDLPGAGPFLQFDPTQIGVAFIDALGYSHLTWGLAREVAEFKPGMTVVKTKMSGLLDSATSLLHEGRRFFAAPINSQVTNPGVLVLVVDASREAEAIRRANQSEILAHALKRIGKVLTMNQGMSQICQAAAHEISSTAELAAVAIWTAEENGTLALRASVGLTRNALQEFESLRLSDEPMCVAELVAASGRKFFHSCVKSHVLTAGFEANACFLKPGGVTAYPLLAGGKLLGVVEMIGREGDEQFEVLAELFETFAEHLALSMSAATTFEATEQLASHDALTGVANHRTMQEFLHRNLTSSIREDRQLAVMMLDVDHFRAFNEEEGHDAGDRVLQLVARTIRGAVRAHDLVARYGGEEFTIIMPGSSIAEAAIAADRIRCAVEDTKFESVTGKPRQVTLSIGVAGYPNSSDDAAVLLRAADFAMFNAKKLGRNTVQVYKGRFSEETHEKHSKVNDVMAWVTEDLRNETTELLSWAGPFIQRLALELRLSEGQQDILEAMVALCPTLDAAYRQVNLELIEKIEHASELRGLQPNLLALEEAWDGSGPRGLKGTQIPLLARVLKVLLAAYEGKPMTDGAFDPEIVEAFERRRRAA